jgi:hypothetical protein
MNNHNLIAVRCTALGCNSAIHITESEFRNIDPNTTISCKHHTPSDSNKCELRLQIYQFDRRFDSGYNSCQRGYQPTKVEEFDGEVPKWASDDSKLRDLLLRAFPRLHTDQKQKLGAARWLKVVTLHYRLRWTESQIAEEMELTISAFRSMVARMKRTATTKPQPRGRPKRVGAQQALPTAAQKMANRSEHAYEG